ncbi:MAG TPA: tol-pal system protein YbgF [Stellaceae bacterium]|nr:tol-pal system protein YbgF [Stellaceae bacterium]
MSWRPLLPHACRTLLLVLVAVIVPLRAAWPQDSDMQDRLDRIERDLNMLQRQVYRSAPAAGQRGGEPNLAVNNEIRMERLEGEMRDLTGRVEKVANEIEQLRQRIEQVNSDVGVRFGQIAGGQGGVAPAAGPPPPALGGPPQKPGGRAAQLRPPTGLNPPPGAPGYDTLTPPGTVPPGPQTASAEPQQLTPPGGGKLPAGSALTQYNYAFGLLKQADYLAAEEAMRSFIREHRNSALAGNAQYWLGETYYARARYAEAASAFAAGFKNYPHGEKAPDDLLKLGMSLARANQKQNACVAFGQLDHAFPHPGAAIKERAGAEKKRLGC